ncbi:MAG: ABC transporter permease [Verrucomicrobia bacterium]|nr:ABC transporter permease [Verrucomicrobiota bacterium]
MRFWMELKEGLAISLDALRANKLRSTLTTLGIVIGIVTVSLMGMAIEGLNRAFLSSISAIGADVFFIQKRPWFSDEPWWKTRGRRDIILAEGKSFVRLANPAWTVSFHIDGIRSVKYDRQSASGVFILGCSAEAAVVDGLTLRQGRFLSSAEVDGERPVCVIGVEIMENLFPHEPPLGKRIRIAGVAYEVVGVLEKRGSFLGFANLDNMVYVPVTRFVSDFYYRPNLTIKVKVAGVAEMADAREELRGIMRRVRKLAPGEPDDFSIQTQEALIHTFDRMSAVLGSAGLFITGLSLFVGGIGIMNIMFVSVAQRTREIGIRKAIGAKRRTIMMQFLIEAALICLLGGLIGLSIAWLAGKLVSDKLPTQLSLTVMSLALLVSLLTGVLAGFFPAWRAAKMNPVDALRNE